MEIRRIALHHSGGLLNQPLASTIDLTAEQIDLAHKTRFGMQSPYTRLWGGYTIFYEKTGKRTQFRAIGEETMAQKGSNFDTISFAFAGNYSGVDKMAASQQIVFENDLRALLDGDLSRFIIAPGVKINIDPHQIKPHYFYSPTECYGTFLPENWGRDLALKHLNLKLSYWKLLLEYLQLLMKRNLGHKSSVSGSNVPCWMGEK